MNTPLLKELGMVTVGAGDSAELFMDSICDGRKMPLLKELGIVKWF